jgi:hypothetical protein
LSDTQQTDIVVSLKYGDLDDAIEWCIENCKEKWDLAEIQEFSGFANGVYHFTFVDDSDAVVFCLRWT